MESIVLGNRYELHEEIGSGGMAHVFRARDQLLDRIVAIKILKPEFTEDAQFIERFRIEAQAAASLLNPNIVMVYDVGQDEDIYYIIMEYVDGVTLKDYINNVGRIGWKEAISLGIQITQAVDSAHLNHIIHRDIKPHNILITRDRKIKVTDFGIARAVTNSTMTTVGNAMGSVHYFSPEQAKGAITDEKSDIYSLGITLYEMVTGNVPFDGETPIAVALKHIQEPPIPPSAINQQVPRGLNAIILKAIEKDKFDRYQSVSEMLLDLKKVLRDPSGATLSIMNDSFGQEQTIDDEYNGVRQGAQMEKRQNRQGSANMSGQPVKRKANSAGKPAGSRERTGNAPIKKRPPIEVERTARTNTEGRYNQKRTNYNNQNNDYNQHNRNGQSRNSRALVIVSLVAVFVAVGFMIWMMISLFGSIEPGKKVTVEDFSVDNYVGLEYSDVSVRLIEEQIKSVEKKVFSNIEKGIIISQSVEKGTKLKLDGTAVIEFEVSDGIERVVIPEFRNTEYRAAEASLKAKGLLTEVLDEMNNDVEKGYVVRTDPSAETEVEIGTKVLIFKSAGSDENLSVVPQLVGKSYAEAVRLLEAGDLTVGTLNPSDVTANAMVIKQSEAPNSSVNRQTAIDLWFEEADNTTSETASTSSSESTSETPSTTETASTTTRESTTVSSSVSVTDTTPTEVGYIVKSITLKLPKNVEYGNIIRLVVEATPSDTGTMKRIINKRVAKDDFPYLIDFTIPIGGKTEIRVFYDGVEMVTRPFDWDE